MSANFPPPDRLELALAQINPVVGDLTGNADLIIRELRSARLSGAQLVLFPELALCGYPPEDLVLRRDFLDAADEQLSRVASEASEIVVVVGFPEAHDGGVANALAVLENGSVVCVYRKMLLPNYGVFDERRYFSPGDAAAVIDAGGVRVGLSVCEDVWFDEPVVSELAAAGAQLIVNASASPFHAGKTAEREAMLADRACRFNVPLAYCNIVGGQDELVFDGASVVIAANGEAQSRLPQFETGMLRTSVELAPAVPVLEGDAVLHARVTVSLIDGLPPSNADAPTAGHLVPIHQQREEEVWSAIVLAVRDYVDKNGFPGVLVGVSGGIDSAVVLALAVDALGSDRVTGVTMPSPFNSPETRADAIEIANRLGCEMHEFSIEPVMDDFASLLAGVIAGREVDQTEENIQARIRGTILMALSNKFGSLVLTTGNKSEMAVGYATLYGDMAGGFAPLKDVPKTLVFDLARWRNRSLPFPGATRLPIPDGIIERPPSAELRPDQTDEASLGSYDVLDEVIERYIERDESLQQVVAAGIDSDFADRITRLIDAAEYKRRQAPPGVKITTRAFGRDRRMPITARRHYR